MVVCAANNVAFCAMHSQLPLTMAYCYALYLVKDVELVTYCCSLNFYRTL